MCNISRVVFGGALEAQQVVVLLNTVCRERNFLTLYQRINVKNLATEILKKYVERFICFCSDEYIQKLDIYMCLFSIFFRLDLDAPMDSATFLLLL